MLRGYTAKNSSARSIFYTVEYINGPCQYVTIKRHWLVFLEEFISKMSGVAFWSNSFAVYIKVCR